MIERFLNQLLISFSIVKSLKLCVETISLTRIILSQKMHVLQPKHIKLNEKDVDELLAKLNVSKYQLPKIILNDPALPNGCSIGNVIKIERKDSETGESF